MEILLNNEWKMTCPDGFVRLDENERRSLHFIAEGAGECLSDPERHMLVTLGWKKVSGLAVLLLSGRDLARQMEKRISAPMQPFGYRLDKWCERQLDGGLAVGFRYRYRAQETDMMGESYVLKSGKTLYYFHLYARAALEEESLACWETMLDSLHRA